MEKFPLSSVLARLNKTCFTSEVYVLETDSVQMAEQRAATDTFKKINSTTLQAHLGTKA